jgi:heat shock protein HslJ
MVCARNVEYDPEPPPAVASVVPAGRVSGTQPVVTFHDDGKLSANGGCNTLASSWTLDGNLLEIDSPGSTRMFCSQPTGVMEQEAALGAVLEATAEVQIAGDTIHLLDEGGSIVVVGTRQRRAGS